MYIQGSDILMLNCIEDTLAEDIYSQYENKITKYNLEYFIEITNPEEIEFLESINWIIDYKKTINLTEEEIIEEKDTILEKLELFNERIRSLQETTPTSGMVESLSTNCRLLEHKMDSLQGVLEMKQGHNANLLPLVPNSDGFAFCSKESVYEIRESLEPNKLLLFRKDGKSLSDSDRIPQGFFQAAMSVAIMEKSPENSFFGNYNLVKNLSPDQKYLVFNFDIQELKEKEQEPKEKPKGIKKFMKMIKKSDKK